MTDLKSLLDTRKRLKARKPEFIRQDFGKKPNLERRWRRPKGIHSKMRNYVKGKPKRVSQGYRSPVKVRGLHESGLGLKRVSSIGDFNGLDPKNHILVISGSLGNKKRIVILKKAAELGFTILNFKNPAKFIEGIEQKVKLRAEAKKKTSEKAKEVKKEEKLSEKVEEERKELEKKEKDKVLTKRER